MKKTYLFALAAMAFCACTSDVEDIVVNKTVDASNGFEATVEEMSELNLGGTRASFTNDGILSFSKNDAITVQLSTGAQDFTYSGVLGAPANGIPAKKFTAVVPEGTQTLAGGYAIFPAQESFAQDKIEIPATMKAGTVFVPMYGTFTTTGVASEDQSVEGQIEFTHLGALLKLRVVGVTSGNLTVEADNYISGTADIVDATDGKKQLSLSTGGKTITYTEVAKTGSYLYIPLAPGTYNLTVKEGNTTLKSYTNLTVGRAQLGVQDIYPDELTNDNFSAAAVKRNGEVKVGEDITTTTAITTAIAPSYAPTIDLQDKTITYTGSGNAFLLMKGSDDYTFNADEDNKGGVTTTNAKDAIVWLNNKEAKLTINGGTFDAQSQSAQLIYCYAGTAYINGGVFKMANSNLIKEGQHQFMLNCRDDNYKNGTANIIVTGGQFYDFNPADNFAEGVNTNFCAEGYGVVKQEKVTEDGAEHTVYTIGKLNN